MRGTALSLCGYLAGLREGSNRHLSPLQLAEQLLVTERELEVAKRRVEAEQGAYQSKLRALCALQAQYSLPLYSGSARRCLPVADTTEHGQPARHQDQARTGLSNEFALYRGTYKSDLSQTGTLQVSEGGQGLPAPEGAGQGRSALPVQRSQAGNELSPAQTRATEPDKVLLCLAHGS